jgi:hypothetical protein
MPDAFDYSRSKATADRLITRFGQAGFLRRPGVNTGTEYDPEIGPPTDYPCTFAVIGWSNGEIAGGRVLATDKKVLLAKGDLQIEPTPSDKLVIGGAEHSIIGPDNGLGIQTLAPAGIIVMWTLQARK